MRRTIRSSGWGPRKVLGVPDFAHPAWTMTLLTVGMEMMGNLWPRDGVAVIIRRAA